MSRRKEGTIRIEVVPQVVLINETTCSIKRKRNDGLILSLCCNELYPLSIDEVSEILKYLLLSLINILLFLSERS